MKPAPLPTAALVLATCVAFLLCCAPRAGAELAAAATWQTQNIYQVITDRFFDGDPGNDNIEGTYDPSGHKGTSVHGGDFKGLEQKLDYIEALGATAIWISPILLNARGEFHGYAARDFYRVAPHWGTLADLQHFVQAAHSRGLRVIDDIVVNHGGDLVDSAEPGYAKFRPPPAGYKLRYRNPQKRYAPPFDLNSTNTSLEALFHNQGAIQNYSDPVQVELGELFGLDDFRTESPFVRSRMAEIYEYWIATAGFDGFRVDTAKHVDMGFWRTWCPAVHRFAREHGKPDFFMFGEVMEVSDAKCASYTGTKAGGPFLMDSVLDYPLYFKINDVFARAKVSPSELAQREAAIPASYEPQTRRQLVRFLDNHDQPRFMNSANAAGNTNRLKTALLFLYTAQGVPCLYYGTEQAFNGANDPYDREDMFAGQFEQGPSLGDNFNYCHPLFQWVAKLNNLRRLYPALTRGEQTNVWSDPAGPGLYVFSRRLGQQEVLVCLNTADAERVLPACPTTYSEGTKLVNLLEPEETVTVEAGGRTPQTEVSRTSGKLLIAQAQRLPLDPVVISVNPAHDAADVPDRTTISLHFSRPMVERSVEAAFSVAPATAGAFAWSDANSTVTFKPAAALPANQLVTVRLGSTAKDGVFGRSFHGAFESRFRTSPAPGARLSSGQAARQER